MTWAVSPPLGSYLPQEPSPFIITMQHKSWQTPKKTHYIHATTVYTLKVFQHVT